MPTREYFSAFAPPDYDAVPLLMAISPI